MTLKEFLLGLVTCKRLPFWMVFWIACLLMGTGVGELVFGFDFTKEAGETTLGVGTPQFSPIRDSMEYIEIFSRKPPEHVHEDHHWMRWLIPRNDAGWQWNWYYKRPGYCPVCGTKGHPFTRYGAWVGEEIPFRSRWSFDGEGLFLECPNCGNLFAAPEKEEQ